MPVVVLVSKGANYEKVCSNMEEVIARGKRVIAVCSEGDHEVRDKVEVALEIPTDGEEVSPIILSRLCPFFQSLGEDGWVPKEIDESEQKGGDLPEAEGRPLWLCASPEANHSLSVAFPTLPGTIGWLVDISHISLVCQQTALARPGKEV